MSIIVDVSACGMSLARVIVLDVNCCTVEVSSSDFVALAFLPSHHSLAMSNQVRYVVRLG